MTAPAAATSPAPRSVPYEAGPLLLAAIVFALACFSQAVLNDGDTWSHVATGNWILAHGEVPRTDPFTFSMPGAPWTAHEWLSEVLLALAYRAAGWNGVVLLTAAAAALACWFFGSYVVRKLGGPAVAVLLAASLTLLTPSLLARPHIFAFPALAFWGAALMTARDNDRAPPLWIAGIITIWANLHGSYAFGLALIGPFALEALIEAAPARRFAVIRDWGLFGILGLIAALITPFGIEGLLFPFKLLDLHYLTEIGEWEPESFAKIGALEVLILTLILFAVLQPVRMKPLRAILLVGLIHMSVSHVRHKLLLSALAPMLLAGPVAEALKAHPLVVRAQRQVIIVFALVGLIIAGARLFTPNPRGDSLNTPATALQQLPPELKAKRVLNDYNFGGYLIFHDMKPFIDGRADMFGDAFLGQFLELISGESESVVQTLDRYDIAWTMLTPSRRLLKQMDKLPGWHRVYTDSFAVIHVRDAAGPAKPVQ